MAAASEEQVPPLTARIREGNQLREEGRIEEARELFLSVWDEANESHDLYHACAVAHQLGVLDPTPFDKKLHWHLESLRLADAMEEVPEHWYTSMYLSAAYAYFHLGKLGEAEAAYQRAAASLVHGDRSEYAQGVKDAIARGLKRLQECRHRGASRGSRVTVYAAGERL